MKQDIRVYTAGNRYEIEVIHSTFHDMYMYKVHSDKIRILEHL